MNKQNENKIEWCDMTLNPVVGCPRGCEYCYARTINNRFNKKYPNSFAKDFSKPEFKAERLKQLNSKNPKSIFMDSMSDIAFWEEEWGKEVGWACHSNPQHNYVFLTKGSYTYPSGFHEIFSSSKLANGSFFIGKTITHNKQFDPQQHYDFLSIEPLLESIDLSLLKYSLYVRQVIIGAETGNRKDKVIPQKEWVDDIVKQCDQKKVRVFMKGSLKKIMGVDFRQDELIWKK